MQYHTNQSISASSLLHVRADRLMRTLIGETLAPYKITMMEWLLLSVVAECPPGGMSMSAVAKELSVTLPQVTALATKPLDLKLITQKTQSSDRRSRHVSPTAKGRRLLVQIETAVEDAFNAWIGQIPEDQYRQYRDTVAWLASHPPVAESTDNNS